jgi:putative transposase
MANYRRDKTPGGWYFFTLVTYHRNPVFQNESAVMIFKRALTKIRKDDPFDILAIVILPDHIHMIMRLPDDDDDYSRRISKIKRVFGDEFLKSSPIISTFSKSNINRRERIIWQRRFWEHKIRNQGDLRKHIDYIHYNPVKHGHVQDIMNWKWSSFPKFVKNGYYNLDLENFSAEDIKGAEWD